jgi:DNA-binding response OmpR family regulator
MAASVLIVNDDRVSMDHLGLTLSLEGYGIRKAHTAEQGLCEALRERPDVVILDVRLPILHRVEILRHMRALDHLHDVPIVIVTSYHSVDDTICQQLHALGADVRFKPLRVEDLVTIVKTLLRGWTEPALMPPQLAAAW